MFLFSLVVGEIPKTKENCGFSRGLVVRLYEKINFHSTRELVRGWEFPRMLPFSGVLSEFL